MGPGCSKSQTPRYEMFVFSFIFSRGQFGPRGPWDGAWLLQHHINNGILISLQYESSYMVLISLAVTFCIETADSRQCRNMDAGTHTTALMHRSEFSQVCVCVCVLSRTRSIWMYCMSMPVFQRSRHDGERWGLQVKWFAPGSIDCSSCNSCTISWVPWPATHITFTWTQS